MPGFLERACDQARARVTAAIGERPLDDIRTAAAARRRPPSLADALSGPGVAVVAEVKRASPSRGDLAPIPDAGALARRYRDGGAAAVSVLTEPLAFKGSLDDLEAVVAAVDIPALRKDFVVDPYQVHEAAAVGAAAVLLIVAALDDAALAGLLRVADEAGLDALVETHTPAEAARAATAHAAAGSGRRLIVGVNARDLATLTVDPGRFAAVRAALPAGAIAVAESGVRGPDDVTRLADLGADAVLVGESVATAADPAAAVAALVAAGRRPAGATP